MKPLALKSPRVDEISAYMTMSPDKPVRLIGFLKGPTLVDVRAETDFTADPMLIAGALRRDHAAVTPAPIIGAWKQRRSLGATPLLNEH